MEKTLRQNLYGEPVPLRQRLAELNADPEVKVTKQATKPIASKVQKKPAKPKVIEN